MTTDPVPSGPDRPVPVARLLRPRSIAIVGISAKPGSAGARTLSNLENSDFDGAIHLVSRNNEAIGNRPCLPSIDALPEDIDVAVLCLPAAAVVDAAAACARRKVGAVIVFASGFAEAGDAGRAAQAALRRIAHDTGLAIAGPNCMGITNIADGIRITFGGAGRVTANAHLGPGLATIAQSGGMGGTIRMSVENHGLPVMYAISTGNEAVLGVEDFLAHMITDDKVRVIALLMEQIRRPQLFLELAQQAHAHGKPIVLLHLGSSAGAREAAQTHTGALAGDFDVMRAFVTRAGVLLVDTLEELMDVSSLLTAFRKPPSQGPAVLTDSGAFKGFALDFCARLGLDLPPLAATTKAAVKPLLPSFAALDNPLDLTAQGITDSGIHAAALQAVITDPGFDSVLLGLMPGSPEAGLLKGEAVLSSITHTAKTVVCVYLGDTQPLHPDLHAAFHAARVPLFRSPERAMRALARITACGRFVPKPPLAPAGDGVPIPPLAGPGVLPEYQGKTFLAAAGIPAPDGALARDVMEARAIAERIGYPVVLKAQAARLAHKSDVGGVSLGIGDANSLGVAWERTVNLIAGARPDLVLDGMLVERMAEPGLELVLGARRDPDWGPVLLLGLGGIWTEVLNDYRLIPAGAGADEILDELKRLSGHALLAGRRGRPPADCRAIAEAAVHVGQLMLAAPALAEVDINPLLVYPEGRGVLALDALLVLGGNGQAAA